MTPASDCIFALQPLVAGCWVDGAKDVGGPWHACMLRSGLNEMEYECAWSNLQRNWKFACLAVTGPSSSSAPARVGEAGGGQLWVEKHKPGSSADLVANPGHIKNLAFWLANWRAFSHFQLPPLSLFSIFCQEDMLSRCCRRQALYTCNSAMHASSAAVVAVTVGHAES